MENGARSSPIMRWRGGRHQDVCGQERHDQRTGVLGRAPRRTGEGGQITIDACCDLVIGDTGKVISRGRDPGADLVHLQACVVKIFGLVASTGPAHELPLANVCNVNRPGKPANSGACVEIWAGTTLLIDSTRRTRGRSTPTPGVGRHARAGVDRPPGERRDHDPGQCDGAGVPRVNNNDTSPAYAVHANQFLRNGHGGDITVISTDSTVDDVRPRDAGQRLHDASNGGGTGGHIVILAHDDVAFGTGVTPAFVQAAGDANGRRAGGGTVIAKSFNGNVTGIAASQINVLGPGGTRDAQGPASPTPAGRISAP